MSKAEEFSAKSEGCKLQHFADYCSFSFTFGDSDNMLVMEPISKLKNGKYISDTIHSGLVNWEETLSVKNMDRHLV